MLDHHKIRSFQPVPIRQGLQNIRPNQFPLLQQLRNEFHSIKNITNPTIQPIRQSPQQFEYSHEINTRESKLIVSMNLQEVFQLNEKLEKDNKILKTQNELVEADYQQMKKNYFIEKQRAKEYSIDLQFNEGIYLSILRDVLKGVDKNQINRKVNKEIRSYKLQYPKYCENGLLQAIEMINQKGVIQIPTNKSIEIQSLQNMKQMKQQFEKMTISNKQTQKCKVCLAYEDDVQRFKKQLQRKNRQNTQLKLSITQLHNEILTLTAQSKKKQMDIDRYQIEVKNLDEQIQELTSLNEKLNTRIINIDNNKNKIQQQHFTQLSLKQKQLKKFLEQENMKLKQHISQLEKDKFQQKRFNQNKQKKLLAEIQRISQMLSSQKQRHEIQVSSLNSYNTQLERQFRQALQDINKLKYNQRNNMEYSRVNNMKMNEMVEHLWKIKEIEFDNLAKYLKQTQYKKL